MALHAADSQAMTLALPLSSQLSILVPRLLRGPRVQYTRPTCLCDHPHSRHYNFMSYSQPNSDRPHHSALVRTTRAIVANCCKTLCGSTSIAKNTKSSTRSLCVRLLCHETHLAAKRNTGLKFYPNTPSTFFQLSPRDPVTPHHDVKVAQRP